MTRLLLDAGHGMSNRKPGVLDSGAVGNGTTEHAEVSVIRTRLAEQLKDRCEVILVPSGSLASKRTFVDKNLQGGVLLSLHLNSGVPSATGVEVLYDDGHPANAEGAAMISARLATGMGLRNRGAKKDTQAAVGNVLILGGAGRRFLLELCFVSNAADLAALRTHGVSTLLSILDDLLDLTPMPTTDPEFDAAWTRMKNAGVYSSFTKKTDVFAADRLAVILSRLVDAVREGRI